VPELVNVPNVDGIPAVAFAPNAGLGIALAGADAVGLPFFGSGAAEWGIFRRGAPVVVCDNVVAFDHKADWAISDYPVEGGQFESYNKVTIPYDVRLVFTAGGSEANRAALLNSLRAIVGDLNYYDAVSPEAVYTPVNLVHLDYRRTAQNGVGLIIVSVWCRQVRQVKSSTAGAAGGADATGSDTPSATGSIGDAASPSGADQVNGGAVQSTSPTAADINNAQGQSFAGDYSVGGYDPTGSGSGTLGNGNFGISGISGTETPQGFSGSGGIAAPMEVTLPEQTVTLPQTSSSISGLQAAGPDQYNFFGGGP
jgi:hypothetical protein